MAETLRALNHLQEEGLVRDIGVSNFNAAQLDEALSVSASPITANQIEYHPYLNQEKLLAHCKSRQVHVTAYSPLGQGRPLRDPVLVEIAGRIGRSPAQVVLKWLLNIDIIAIPRARSAEHLQANLDLFTWELTAEDQAAIDAIKTVERYVSPPWARWDEV
jgi:diketogulonate reductase-like aldo/keto reductase